MDERYTEKIWNGKSIADLLDFTRESGCSDLHLTVGHLPWFRRGAEMQRISEKTLLTPFTSAQFHHLTAVVMTPEQRKEYDQGKEIDLSVRTDKGNYRINVARPGFFVGRAVPSTIRPLDSLGIPKPICDYYRTLERGIVFVTGSTGSGKTTTLAAMIEDTNLTSGSHVLTIEDPIEFIFESKRSLIHQREVGKDIPTSILEPGESHYSHGVKYAMREDPDIIFVGEMRDRSTAEAIIAAAYSGHLVLSTLHTRNAAATIGRVLSFFPPERQADIALALGDNIEIIISQSLLPYHKENNRVLAVETLRRVPALAHSITDAKNREAKINDIIQTHGRFGMGTLDRSIFEFYKAEKIDGDTAYRYAIYKDAMKEKLDFKEL